MTGVQTCALPIFKKLIREEVENNIELTTEELPISEISAITAEAERTKKELDGILSYFPSSEGYYGKLYRQMADGRLEYKFHIDSLESLEDPELAVANLIREHTWPGGKYVLRVQKRGEPGVRKAVTWNISSEPQTPVSPVNPLSNIKEVVETLKVINGGNPQPSSDLLSETFKSGIETAKALVDLTGSKDNSDSEAHLISILKDLGLFNKKQDFNLIELAQVLIPFAFKFMEKKKDDDSFSMILKLKEIGLIKLDQEKNDILNSTEKISQLMELANLLNPKETGNPTIEAVRVIAPAIPNIINNLSTAVAKIAEAKIAAISQTSLPQPQFQLPNEEVVMPLPSPLPSSTTTTASDNIKTKTQSVKPQQENDKMKVEFITKNILQAIKDQNIEFYPELKQLIYLYLGPHVLTALLNDQITLDTFLSQIYLLSPAFNIPETKTYLEKFINWEKDSSDLTIVKCINCDEEYEIEKGEILNETDLCSVCNKPIIIKTESIIPDISEPGNNDNNKDSKKKKTNGSL